jgi:hypothetical protein
LLAVQPVFFAMSGMIFPEMMLTLFTIAALWGLIKGKWLVYILAGSLAMMVKESAIVIPATAITYLFIEGLRKKELGTVKRWIFLFFAGVPLLVYAGFLVIQKFQNGWYFFPEHIGYIHFSGDAVLTVIKDIFLRQGKWFLTIFSVAAIVHLAFKHQKGKTPAWYPVVGIFLIFSILFSAFNFYLFRYVLFVLPFTIALSADGILGASVFMKKAAFQTSFSFVSLLIAVGLAGIYMDRNKFNDAADMSYKHIVKLQQEAVNFVEQQPWKDSLFAATFPMEQALSDKRYGYLKGKNLRTAPYQQYETLYGIFFSLKKDEPVFWYARKFDTIKTFHYKDMAYITIIFFVR